MLDLGCGTGAQTLHLAELTSGPVLAVDLHAPFVARLNAEIDRRGLAPRVRAQAGDMAGFEPATARFDLVWSEGALYSIGLARALRVCHDRLRPGGYLAFTDAVWRKPDPPPEVKASFAQDYPTMGWTADVKIAVRETGFDLLDRFTLPDEAWWDDFYTPMRARIDELRAIHAGDDNAQAALDTLAQEPEMHRRYSDTYAYVFFIARRSEEPRYAERPA